MTETPTIGRLWRDWRDVLIRLGFETAALDAKLLAQHALGLDALALATRENDPVDAGAAVRVAKLMQWRMTGKSVARIIGHREFYGLDFILNGATLEPRPETELLVDMALARLPQGGALLDLGTGTGCIPIAVLANRPDTKAVAVELSLEALDAASLNSMKHGVSERLRELLGSWFEPLKAAIDLDGWERVLGSGKVLPLEDFKVQAPSQRLFDLIVSNPPYITSAVVETLALEVKDFDPRLALDGGPDGLAPYRVIAAEADAWLSPNGSVLVEIGHDQGAPVSALFLEAGFENVSIHKDLNGLDRVVSAHHL